MRHVNNKICDPLTIDELVAICHGISGLSRLDAIKYGREHNITRHNVDALRQMLGFAKGENYAKLSAEQKAEIVREYESGGTSVKKLAVKYGVGQNSISCILKARKVDTTNPRLFTPMQNRRIIDFMNKGTPLTDIAMYFGKNKSTICAKIRRMKIDLEFCKIVRELETPEQVAERTGMTIDDTKRKIRIMKMEGLLK